MPVASESVDTGLGEYLLNEDGFPRNQRRRGRRHGRPRRVRYDADDAEIPFEGDLTAATVDLDIGVRDVMEIPSAYASHRGLPDEISDHGDTIERDTDYDGPGERYTLRVATRGLAGALR